MNAYFPVSKTRCQYQTHACHQPDSSMNADSVRRLQTDIKVQLAVLIEGRMMFPVAILDSISKLRILCCWHQGLRAI